ncbi:hypothetical protein [Xanthomonas bundabergensis]|uniref:hypothetical protein n=1 Tax=Xanthomonas bundabergensis TaxID=3160842 RepID=UPI0035116D32
MATCDVCGNDDVKAFSPTQGARSGPFAALECAIHGVALHRSVGHGVDGAADRV